MQLNAIYIISVYYLLQIKINKCGTGDTFDNDSNLDICVEFNPHSFYLFPVCSEEVRSIIMSLHNSRSSGIDEILVNVITHCANNLVDPLHHLISCSNRGASLILLNTP